jgi:hypothetical protein
MVLEVILVILVMILVTLIQTLIQSNPPTEMLYTNNVQSKIILGKLYKYYYNGHGVIQVVMVMVMVDGKKW